jgi:hypothetical protein
VLVTGLDRVRAPHTGNERDYSAKSVPKTGSVDGFTMLVLGRGIEAHGAAERLEHGDLDAWEPADVDEFVAAGALQLVVPGTAQLLERLGTRPTAPVVSGYRRWGRAVRRRGIRSSGTESGSS